MKNYIGFSRDHSGSMRSIARAAAKDYNSNIASIREASLSQNQDTIVSVVECGYGNTDQVRRDIVNSNVTALQPLAEGSEFGAYYYEKVAQEIFDKRQDISSEDEVLNQAYKIVSNDQGQKSARYMFNYDEDFPSDVVSSYFWLQKNKQGVSEVSKDTLDRYVSKAVDAHGHADAAARMSNLLATNG